MDSFGPQPSQTTATPPAPTVTRSRRPSAVVGLILAVCLYMAGIGLSVSVAAVSVARYLPVQVQQTTQSQQSESQDGSSSSADTGTQSGSGAEQGSSSSRTGTGTETTTSTTAPSAGVVLIQATTTDGVAAGTGMVLTSDGYVLTNNHVITGSSSVSVTIADSGATYVAKVVGVDTTKDVALLSLTGASGLTPVTIDKDTVGVGDTVVALGNANGQQQLVAADGQVTALSQSLQVSSDSPWGTTENLSGMIETDAGAVPGDSGGPMYDAEGEVLGMTTAGSTTENVSYAVPISTALSIVDQIKSGQESGTVQIGPAGYLGITSSTAASTRTGGLVISEVVKGGPAAKVGIAAGDTLVAFNGTKITATTNAAALIRATEPGQSVSVTWTDGTTGETKTAKVTMGSSPLN